MAQRSMKVPLVLNRMAPRKPAFWCKRFQQSFIIIYYLFKLYSVNIIKSTVSLSTQAALEPCENVFERHSLNVTHVIRFLIGFHGFGDVLHPLDGAADIRVLDNGRLVGDTGGGGITCRGGGKSRDRLQTGFIDGVILQRFDVFLVFVMQDLGSGQASAYFRVLGFVSAASPEMSEMSMSVGNSLFWRISWLGRFMVEKNIMLGMVSMKT